MKTFKEFLIEKTETEQQDQLDEAKVQWGIVKLGGRVGTPKGKEKLKDFAGKDVDIRFGDLYDDKAKAQAVRKRMQSFLTKSPVSNERYEVAEVKNGKYTGK